MKPFFKIINISFVILTTDRVGCMLDAHWEVLCRNDGWTDGQTKKIKE